MTVESPTQPCPSCGIAVMIGYVKCPKCHAPMPGAGAGRARRASLAGGTTAQPPTLEPVATGGTGAWLALAGLVFAGLGLGLWARCRGGDRPADRAATVVEEAAPAVGTAPADEPTDDVRPAPVAAGTRDPAIAADALEGELAGERLFATVDVTGDLLDVRSAFCNEAGLSDAIARHAAELKGAGVVRVRCSETYGTAVFERGL